MSAHRIPEDTLAARLLMVRHELGISQREASERSGVPFGIWQGMESGRGTINLPEHIQKISDAFGYDRSWLAFGSDQE